MSSKGVVPGFNPSKDRQASFLFGPKGEAIDEFTLEGGEEVFTKRIVIAVTDRAHGRADAQFPAALTEGY